MSWRRVRPARRQSFPGGDGADVLDLDLAGDDLVAERGHEGNDKLETILALIGDQNPQMIGPSPSGATSQS